MSFRLKKGAKSAKATVAESSSTVPKPRSKKDAKTASTKSPKLKAVAGGLNMMAALIRIHIYARDQRYLVQVGKSTAEDTQEKHEEGMMGS